LRQPDVAPEVVAAAQAGDERAFARIVEHYQRSVFGLAYRMTQDAARAEDLAQEVFLRVWRKLDLFRLEEPLRPWLLRLATNVCLNALKKRQLPTLSARADDELGPREPVAKTPTAPELAERRELLALLERTIAGLPEEYRLVVTLRHVDGLAYEEIAESLGWPLGTVKVRLFRARERLREMLGPLLG
jgi:RNA polymerase sigma-70 factor (ECF subfamily)